jgi:hypothetical protein
MKKLNLLDEVYGENGYSLNLKLSDRDLELMQKMIRMQWLYRLQLLAPHLTAEFDQLGIEQYHELAHVIDHSSAWAKTSRVLPRESVDAIRKMDFFKQMEYELGEIKIPDEEKLGWPNVYWRLVRPGNSDFGTLHTENWFVNLGYYGSEINDVEWEKIKIWISIHATPGKNGLIVVPKSHRNKDWKWHAIEKYGQKKPVIDEDVSKLNQELLHTEPGRAVVFNYDLLHGGAENLADLTRISMEFTFMIRKDRLTSYHA